MEFFAEWIFGGREGCLGAFYAPTPQELLREEHRRLLRLVRASDRDLAKEAVNLQTLQKRIVADAAASRWEVARRGAIELHRSRLTYDRLGTQKDNILRVADRIKGQLSAVSIDQSLVLLVRVMSARLQLMSPDRFARVMARYEALKEKESMTEQQMRDFFGSEDDVETEKISAGSDEKRVALIFAELGVRDLGPPVPTATPALGGEDGETGVELLDIGHLQSRFDALRTAKNP